MKQTQEQELIAELYSALRFLLADYIAIEGEKLTGSNAPMNIAQAALKRAETWENTQQNENTNRNRHTSIPQRLQARV